MLCSNCQKNNAIIHYTEVVKGIKKKQHLCQECADQILGQQMGKEDILSHLLADIFNCQCKDANKPLDSQMIKCECCGLTYEEFIQKGKLGCYQCVETFRDILDQCIRKVQGSNRHIGKSFLKEEVNEKITDPKQQIKKLRQLLEQAVKDEEYEDAARYRDAIKALNEVN